MSHVAARLTLYAIISSIEMDLRHLLSAYLGMAHEADEILGTDLLQIATDRLEKDQGALTSMPPFDDLLPYLDYADSYHVLNKNSQKLPKQIAEFLKSNTNRLEQIANVRNRVMHARPLNFDDLPKTLEYATLFVNSPAVPWVNLKSTLDRMKNEPSFVFGLNIPITDDAKTQSHNLPTPDFDETGFLGREKQVTELVRLCFGTYPVITIFGEGGVGKTALALKVSYEILDAKDSPFDTVVWTSAKTARLTVQEVVQIEGAITDSLGLFSDVAKSLAGAEVSETIDEILQYLKEFRILLVLDNLETVLDARVRNFLERLPSGSKVLITSRIGLGAFDFPYKLQALPPGESVQLLRAVAEIRGVAGILQISNKKLEEYCARMKHNPGYIKWFVSAVQAGKRPEEVLAKPDIFLDFCMTNVYQYLNDFSKEVLQVMLAVPGKYNQAELVFLTNLDVIALQQALQQLITTNFVLMTSKPIGNSFETRYSISELAREFLVRHYPPPQAKSDEYVRRKRHLVATGEKLKAEQIRNPYSYESVTTRSAGDLLIARYLLDAIGCIRRSEFPKANEALGKAKTLAPDFFEVFRVEALLRLQEGNAHAARDAYESAIALEPRSAPLRLWYGNFLLRYFDDLELAAEQFQIAEKLDPNAEEIKLEQARIAMYRADYKKSEELLNELAANLRNYGGWMQRKYNNLRLSLYQRKADTLADEHDYNGAIEIGLTLRSYFDSIPELDIDDRMRYIVAKSYVTVMKCFSHLEDVGTRLRANELMGWIKDATGDQWKRVAHKGVLLKGGTTENGGVVCRLMPNYGFIKTDGHETIFFHRSALADIRDWPRMRLGSKVAFTEALDSQDRKLARQVRFL
jgi:LuxR family glucitol operon transcriptional activator